MPTIIRISGYGLESCTPFLWMDTLPSRIHLFSECLLESRLVLNVETDTVLDV